MRSLAVLPGSIVHHSFKFNAFISILIDIPWSIIRQDRWPISYFGCLYALLESASSSLFSGSTYSSNVKTALGVLSFTQQAHSQNSSVTIHPSLSIDFYHVVKKFSWILNRC